MKKFKKISSIVVLVLVTGYLVFWYIPNKKMRARCVGYNPEWAPSLILDCYGLISVRQGWDLDYYYYVDNIHNYELARTDSENQFIVSGDYMYIISRESLNSEFRNEDKLYYQQYFKNGVLNRKKYNSQEEIPLYIKVDYKTGELDLYKNINEVPGGEKKYFEELLAKTIRK